jgi:hypothetical protein
MLFSKYVLIQIIRKKGTEKEKNKLKKKVLPDLAAAQQANVDVRGCAAPPRSAYRRPRNISRPDV